MLWEVKPHHSRAADHLEYAHKHMHRQILTMHSAVVVHLLDEQQDTHKRLWLASYTGMICHRIQLVTSVAQR